MYDIVSDIPKLPLFCFVLRDTELDLLLIIKFKNYLLNQDLEFTKYIFFKLYYYI